MIDKILDLITIGLLCFVPGLSYSIYKINKEYEKDNNHGVRIIVSGKDGYLCSRCGARYSINAKYCPDCGVEFIDDVEITVPDGFGKS